MLIEYYPSESYIHKLDVRTKAFYFFIFTIISFSFYLPLINLFLVVLLWLLLLSIHTPFNRVKHIIKPLIPVFIIMLFITGLTYPVEKFHSSLNKQIILNLLPNNTLPFTVGGFMFGITLVLRIFVMILASSLVTFSTSIEDILQLMKKIRMPYQLAFIIATGIRFIPTMQKKAEMIQEAQKVRGTDFDNNGIIKSIKSYIPVLIPMIVDSLRMSDNLAIAMLNRGFGAMKKTTDLHEIKMHVRDYVICFIGILILAIALWANSKNIGAL